MAAPRPTGPSSAPPTRTSAEDFALSGPSAPPDHRFHAFRKDLADVALIGRVIASHYAEPMARIIAAPTALRDGPSDDAQTLLQLEPGQPFAMLDNSLGWAWGYGGDERLVGYVPSSAVAAAEPS